MDPYKAWLINHLSGLDIDIIKMIKIMSRYSIIEAPSNRMLHKMMMSKLVENGISYTSQFIHNGVLMIGNTKFPIDGHVIGSGYRFKNGKLLDIYYTYRRLNSVDYSVYVDIEKAKHVECNKKLNHVWCEVNQTDVHYIHENVKFIIWS